ncbi:MAG: hypothetical protein JEY99_12665 [Spirochaetales bacterium]|nr:hypothetical protein [Spirochaetales bacterium]
MTIHSMRLLYPDGEWQETETPLYINEICDMNGHALRLPYPASMRLIYRVYRISTSIETGEEIRCFHLEQLTMDEIQSL